MKLFRMFPVFAVLLLTSYSHAGSTLEQYAERAVFDRGESAATAIAALRKEKQEGLDAVFNRFSREIEEYRKTGTKRGSWNRIAEVIDSVAKQRDAYSSRLFWHTDFEEAKRASKARGLPILSLRLLGNLDEELSCANSRFFRSILYSDPRVADALRAGYILHWESVRPAPKITIEFGDGRTLVRTITGNSIHYFLDHRGRIIDALPGLYTPQKFLGYLVSVKTAYGAGAKDPRRFAFYRSVTANALISEWESKLAATGIEVAPVILGEDDATGTPPTALAAAPRAVTKAAVEMATVLSLAPRIESLNRQTGDQNWRALADLAGTVEISNESRAVIRSKTAGLSDSEFEALLAKLSRNVQLDTIQNEFRFHTQILAWLDPVSASDVEMFNERVYSALFLTPDSDPWLGLYEQDIFAAIENNGVR